MLMGLPAQITGMQQPQQPLLAQQPARDQLIQALMNGPPPAQQQSTPTGGSGMPLGMLQAMLSQQQPQGGAPNIPMPATSAAGQGMGAGPGPGSGGLY